MSELPPFKPGQTIVLREIWDGKIWNARPCIVVLENPELIAFYIPPETIVKEHIAADGSPFTVDNRIHSEWILEDNNHPRISRLKLIVPGTGYSVIIFWNSADGSQEWWYINLEDPIGKTSISYDYIDLLLDVIVSPDTSEWRWDDEDELAAVVSAGLISPEKATELYRVGEQAVKWLQSGKSPFNGWEEWKPDPSWEIPVLPDGWDKV